MIYQCDAYRVLTLLEQYPMDGMILPRADSTADAVLVTQCCGFHMQAAEFPNFITRHVTA